MLKWLATNFERRRASWQARLERSLPGAAVAAPQVSSAEWRRRGNEHLNAGRLNEAAVCYRRGMQSDPDDAICYSNLGYVLGELGRSAESREMLLKAAALDPADFDARYMLGNLAKAQGDSVEAIAHYRAALSINPAFEVGRRDLCVLLAQTGQLREARTVLEQGPAFDPAGADFHYFKGNLHLASDEADEAIACFRRAAELQPRDASILINLGVAQLKRREVFAAIETYRSVLAFEPENVQVHTNLAAAFQQSGQLELAVQSYRRALELNPEYLNAHQNLLFSLTYLPDASSADYLVEARRYGERVAARAKPYDQWLCPPFSAAARPLRIGFVSGDLRTHPVGLFLENILPRFDRAGFALVAYSTSMTEDVLSERLKRSFSEWHSVGAMPDEALAGKIHADKIDILVDLAGHTGLNRLPVFAWKPAPLQVSWLGYWASTGVAEIDYVLADPVSVPQAEAGSFTEKVWYLPDTRMCLSAPVTRRPIEVTDPPALRNGHVTFGSYQILNKINDRTLQLWSRVLARIPSARLRLQSLPLAFPEAIADIRKRLAAAGIDPGRVQLHGGAPRDDYLASYGEVDMVLDTFPFPGGTTTAEALWMGVPTLTLTGRSMLARQGESMLRCVGLDGWVAASEAEYVESAVARANDLEGLRQLRAALRSRALASPLFDAPSFAANLQQAFIAMARGAAPPAPPVA